MNIRLENKFSQTSVNIERIHKPTREEFKNKTLSYRKPVIITGKIPDWKAFGLWSIDYLNTVIGNKEVDVNVSKNKMFTVDPETEVILPSKKIQFTEFTDWIIQEKKADQYYYLQQSPIQTSFPELFPDIEIPDYMNQNLFMITNLWIGTGGNITPLHWDAAQNLLSQVRGRKRILLFEPKQISFLYPFSVHSQTPHISHLNIDKLDIEKFPKFQKAKYTECILEPGEMLFIPAFWWHQVYSLDQLNIAVNFWWKANLKDYFTAPARRFLLKKPNLFWVMVLQKPNLFWKIIEDFAGLISYKKRV
ncbi:cupin-like domain-containing protein [Nodularia sp. NIES-3585]|uniref:cupin-like domain-containing protein n=1 Tax=Nodularia sp. NIES-3585 TaxID=1973477 RepID=UPI000B5CE0D6|nr:cupin-like domain-containing protein [Nodularia sp. NIES-3585]GAX38631.1 hypothetical protein NIES3585_46810 [Nodularia sp. NIES-3585]